jgi:hypothetical protein
MADDKCPHVLSTRSWCASCRAQRFGCVVRGRTVVYGKLWAPRLRLGGIITDYRSENSMLIGYRIETVIGFLQGMDDQIVG